MTETQPRSTARADSTVGVPSTGVSILDRIVATKAVEVRALVERIPELEQRLRDAPPVRPVDGLRRPGDRVSLIAEVKRRSPGAGAIRPDLSPSEMAGLYEAGGAAALSVLTDRDYFGGSLEDMQAAREAVSLPVLRKDFTIHEAQLIEARASGADLVLLIARILDQDRLKTLHREARDLGLSVLVEAHDREEVDRALEAGAEILGINNRDLSTFRTDLSVTLSLAGHVPSEVVLVAESGIRTRDDVTRLGAAGVDAILVGESLLRQESIEAGARELVDVPSAARG